MLKDISYSIHINSLRSQATAAHVFQLFSKQPSSVSWIDDFWNQSFAVCRIFMVGTAHFFQLNTLKDTIKAPALRPFKARHPKIHQNGLLTPMSYDEHPCPFLSECPLLSPVNLHGRLTIVGGDPTESTSIALGSTEQGEPASSEI